MSDPLNPVARVKLSGGTEIEVRELSWPDAIEFLKSLAKVAAPLMRKNDAGNVAFDTEQLPSVVAESGELSSYLIARSVGYDATQMRNLTTSDGLAILDKALELNLSPELMKRGNAVAKRLRETLGAATSLPQSTGS